MFRRNPDSIALPIIVLGLLIAQQIPTLLQFLPFDHIHSNVLLDRDSIPRVVEVALSNIGVCWHRRVGRGRFTPPAPQTGPPS
ncbi:MAG TPA: hypothetical protein VKV15_27010 [Bryobacteraceae bacterium]|nr:hypothetical protein [Bryobacteraceae bacterium]